MESLEGLSKEVTRSDLPFNRTPLAASWRIDCWEDKGRSRETSQEATAAMLTAWASAAAVEVVKSDQAPDDL